MPASRARRAVKVPRASTGPKTNRESPLFPRLRSSKRVIRKHPQDVGLTKCPVVDPYQHGSARAPYIYEMHGSTGIPTLNTSVPARLVIDPDLIRKYGGNGPRYTSYPTADRFVEAFDADASRHWLANRRIGGFTRPLGVYVHVPFCDTLC